MIKKDISYKDGDTSLNGYLVHQEDSTPDQKSPGVILVPEWWGLDDYIRSRAEQMAELGYVAFAIDMYGADVTAETPEKATELSKPFYEDRDLMRSRAMAGLNTLLSQDNVDATHIAAAGYCFGGTVVLELARGGVDLKGVVSFHGGLATPKPCHTGDVKAQVLALNGQDDPFVPMAEKQAFLDEMDNAHVTYKSIDFKGATHAFTNPAATARGQKFDLPIAYDETADKASWKKMTAFFEGILR